MPSVLTLTAFLSSEEGEGEGGEGGLLERRGLLKISTSRRGLIREGGLLERGGLLELLR